MPTADPLLQTPDRITDPARSIAPFRQAGGSRGTAGNRLSRVATSPTPACPSSEAQKLRPGKPLKDHPLMRMELCRIPRHGRISAATAGFIHGLLVQAGRKIGRAHV